ncbi:MAG: hypothetical protein Q9191_006054 [Dirinaria sp. TL-2023a]
MDIKEMILSLALYEVGKVGSADPEPGALRHRFNGDWSDEQCRGLYRSLLHSIATEFDGEQAQEENGEDGEKEAAEGEGKGGEGEKEGEEKGEEKGANEGQEEKFEGQNGAKENAAN